MEDNTSLGQPFERGSGLFCDGGGCFGQVVVNFEDAGGCFGQGLERVHGAGPVDHAAGSVAGPEMFVAHGVIVVDVNRADAATEGINRVHHSAADVRMAYVEADTDAGEMAESEYLHQVFGSRRLIEDVLSEQTHAQRLGEGVEMFESSQGVFLGARGPGVHALAEMDDEVFEVEVLSGFESPLDFVHSVDAARLFRMEHVDRVGAGAAHFPVGIERRVHRPWLEGVGSEPHSEFVDVLAAGVVKVLAGGEDFDSFSAAAGGQLQQPGMQALLQKQVRR